MSSFVSFVEGLRMWADRASMGELLNAVSVLANEFNARGLKVTFKAREKGEGDAKVSLGNAGGPAARRGTRLGRGDYSP